MTDLQGLSLRELQERRAAIDAEIHRRQVIDHASRQIDQIAARVLREMGEEPGGPWRQPTGAHDAYPLGWVVEHEGKTWVSLVHANVWEPGVSGWREVTEGIPEWVQPSGAHDAYGLGEIVTWAGRFWRSLIEANVWEPGVHGWIEVDEEGQVVVPDPDPDPEPEPDPDPEPEPTDPEPEEPPTEPTPEDPEPEEPTYPDFEQPTGDHDAYSTGDRVLFEGHVYESLIDNNVWSPRDYPQGWKIVEETP